MSEKQLPPGLSVAELVANLPCDWFRISKAKRGPNTFWACKFCNRLSASRTCPMEAVRDAHA